MTRVVIWKQPLYPRVRVRFAYTLLNVVLYWSMRGAFGKPLGTCARISIGQVLLSVRCRDSNSHHAQEALRRAKFKFLGRQKIIVSSKWGVTPFKRTDYLKWKAENRIVPDGVNAKVRRSVLLFPYRTLNQHLKLDFLKT
nr:60S ribosomal protein L10-like [Nicotiana tomentosiformis]